MTTAEQILVVFLSTALAVFLVVAIVVAVQAVRLLKILQDIAQKADNLVTSAESVGTMVRQTVGRLTLLRFIRGVVGVVQDHGTKQSKKGSE